MRNRALQQGVALLLVSTLLAACGSDDSNASLVTDDEQGSTSPTPTPTSGTEPTRAPAPTPPPGEAGQINLVVDNSLATASEVVGAGCLACTVNNVGGVLDGNPENFATMMLNLAALGAGLDSTLGISVEFATTVLPGVALPLDRDDPNSAVLPPNNPGFVVSFPDAQLLSASVLPILTVEAHLGDELVSETSYAFGLGDSIALGLVGIDINNAPVYLGTETNQPYDSVRVVLTGVLADALLNLDVLQTGLHGFSGSISGDF